MWYDNSSAKGHIAQLELFNISNKVMKSLTLSTLDVSKKKQKQKKKMIKWWLPFSLIRLWKLFSDMKITNCIK